MKGATKADFARRAIAEKAFPQTASPRKRGRLPFASLAPIISVFVERTLDLTQTTYQKQQRSKEIMGKGDLRTRRGKIFRGTYGKTRPRKKRRKDVTKEQTSATSEQSKETPANETQVAKA